MPVPVTARSKARVYDRSPTGIVGSNPAGAWMYLCVECCVLSGRGLCDGLITRPEKSYRLWCVVVCDLETSRMRRTWPALGRSATKKNIYIYLLIFLVRFIYYWPRYHPVVISQYLNVKCIIFSYTLFSRIGSYDSGDYAQDSTLRVCYASLLRTFCPTFRIAVLPFYCVSAVTCVLNDRC